MNENHQKTVDAMQTTIDLQRNTIASMRLVMHKQGLALDRAANLVVRLKSLSVLDRLKFALYGGL